ncbi:glycosyltransferase [Bacteroides caecimuris]|uniref:glycosyltransferase n=1 Tax=Bacteroides caecimuris TaxID=1796613 RepID=UPI00138F1BA5|nr:glycosyltransferase [Bacteroides caecimuris]NDO61714.1 glycosyltransferase [Bacteroides caecimuris]
MAFELFTKNKNHHILYSLLNRKWAYISYIPEVYYKKKDLHYMLSHQNKREALIIGEIFHRLGYNVKVALFNDSKECDDRKYDIIFGLEPNFITMCKKNPKALKIYYATGAYWEHQIASVITQTDLFNKTHNTHLQYSRLVKPHNSCEIADTIFQIGSSFTIKTYPQKLQQKIKIINQSSNFTGLCNLEKKLETTSNTEFIWFGSDGSILKGLDIVIEYFMQNTQLKLHIVGPIDPDFKDYFQPRTKKYTNIIWYGFLHTYSEEFMNIAYKASFNIFPSGSEGCPGSVITLMQMGVIPIVSPCAAFDKIEEYGYLLPNLSIKAIDKAMQWSRALSPTQTQELIIKNISYSKQKWNIQQFEYEFHNLLKSEITNHTK